MRSFQVVLTVLVALAPLAARAQYPSRGAPDPSFNNGRPRVIAATPSGGLDQGYGVVRLSGTRYVVADVRGSQNNDAVIVVDTTPENAVVFDVAFTADDDLEQLVALAPVGSMVVLGGGAQTATGNAATLQMRDIGIGATPAFVDRGSLVVQPGDATRPLLYTSAVAAEAVGDGSARIWQARTAYTTGFTCSGATLNRLDWSNGAFSARDQLDLSALIARVCVEASLAIAEPRAAGDPVRSLIVGGACADADSGNRYLCLVRVLDQGGHLSVDPAYGVNGVATYGPYTGIDLVPGNIALDAAGNAVVAITRTDTVNNATPIVVRLRPNGSLDLTFSNGGTYGVNLGNTQLATAGSVAIAADGTLQISGASNGPTGIRPYVTYYDPVTKNGVFVRTEFTAAEPDYFAAGYLAGVPLPAGGTLVVGAVQDSFDTGHTLIARLAGDRQTLDLLEYHHAAFDHYFVTGILDEMRKLDDGTFAGWARTGESFAALPVGAAAALDVCRFFSTTFAPKSSHFYTPIPAECQSLKAGQVWGYEGLVFALQLPDGNGKCSVTTAPLYRLYNQGQGGAPNHRYTVSDALRTGQEAQGWVTEGNGVPPVFACVPRP